VAIGKAAMPCEAEPRLSRSKDKTPALRPALDALTGVNHGQSTPSSHIITTSFSCLKWTTVIRNQPANNKQTLRYERFSLPSRRVGV
jgi:hypothetical protein